jgi:hypothetical protein
MLIGKKEDIISQEYHCFMKQKLQLREYNQKITCSV